MSLNLDKAYQARSLLLDAYNKTLELKSKDDPFMQEMAKGILLLEVAIDKARAG